MRRARNVEHGLEDKPVSLKLFLHEPLIGRAAFTANGKGLLFTDDGQKLYYLPDWAARLAELRKNRTP